jgi:hypothetical protein
MVEQFIRRGFHFESRYQYGTLPVVLLEIDETAPEGETENLIARFESEADAQSLAKFLNAISGYEKGEPKC